MSSCRRCQKYMHYNKMVVDLSDHETGDSYQEKNTSVVFVGNGNLTVPTGKRHGRSVKLQV